MQSVNEIVEAIHKLPSRDQEKIRQTLEKERLEKQKEVEEQVVRFKAAEQWLKGNRAEYLGQWVCLYGDELIAHGTDALEVDRKARNAGIESPFLEHVVEEKYPFGGW